jgi:hypothetical protein
VTERELRDEIERLDAELRALARPPPTSDDELATLAGDIDELIVRKQSLLEDEKQAAEIARKLKADPAKVRAEVARLEALQARDVGVVGQLRGWFDAVLPEPEERPVGCTGAIVLGLAAAAWGWW